MKPIEDWLRETIGLDVASVGPTLVQRAVRHRMRTLGLRRPADYRQFLEHSKVERHELVESVVVTETWFFRDPEPIAAFVRLVREEWLPAHASTPLRLLSVPCSSGEEPFSIVMALLDARMPAQSFQMDAVDISSRALARAARGLYGRNSFRGKDLAFRERYFRPSPEGFALDPAVRSCVRFFQGNFVGEDFLNGQASYDFIFCRNLLIYFDPMMRRKALDKIERLLAPAGVLFVSPVEQPLAFERGFVKASLPMSFACRKAPPGMRRQRFPSPPRQPGLAPGPPLKRQAEPRPKPGSGRLTLPASTAAASRGSDLETARRLADLGHLKEAAAICEAHLRENWASAQAYYLLGLARDAGGEPGALDCYRKALYLEPNHYEGLLQMALLLQKHGYAARARAFKSRAQRLKMRQ